MVGGVISDIYHTEGNCRVGVIRESTISDSDIDRNTPMALFAGSAFLGTGLGPLCSGFIAQHISWRWVFYVQVITSGLVILAVTIFFKETRGSVLLSRRAKLLNSWYEAREKVGLVGLDVVVDCDGKKQSQRIRWKVKADEERESLARMIRISVYRPFCKLYPFYFTDTELKSYSSTVDRASRLLLLSMGRIQLGCVVPMLLGHTACIH